MQTAYLNDPLSETTRKKRRALLAATVAGIALSVVGLVPTKIEAIGMTFTTSNARNLLLFMAAIILYYFFGYFIYSRSDYKTWEIALVEEVKLDRLNASDNEILRPEREARFQSANTDLSRRAELSRVLISDDISKRLKAKKEEAKRISIFKRLYDFWLPLIAAVLAIYSLLWDAFHKYSINH